VVAAFRRCWQRSDFRKVLVQAIGMEL